MASLKCRVVQTSVSSWRVSCGRRQMSVCVFCRPESRQFQMQVFPSQNYMYRTYLMKLNSVELFQANSWQARIVQLLRSTSCETTMPVNLQQNGPSTILVGKLNNTWKEQHVVLTFVVFTQLLLPTIHKQVLLVKIQDIESFCLHSSARVLFGQSTL